MLIETQAAGPFMKNGFIVSCERTREAVLIDPGDEVGGLLAYAERHDLKIREILLTQDRKSTRLNSSHVALSRMPSSA